MAPVKIENDGGLWKAECVEPCDAPMTVWCDGWPDAYEHALGHVLVHHLERTVARRVPDTLAMPLPPSYTVRDRLGTL
jgi:hypothetical protein